MMKKIILIMFLAVSATFAQSAGNTGLSFLKFGFGAKNIAMGDAGVVTANDVSALNYNPANLADFKTAQISVTHNSWLTDVNTELIGVSFKLFGLPLAAGFNYTYVSDIEVRTRPGEAQSTFNANYFYGSLSTGFYIWDALAFGTTVKYLAENLYTDESNGIAVDLGLSYTGFYEGLRLGASIKNLGSMNELRNVETKLPVDTRVGAAYKFPIESANANVEVAAGIQKYSENEDLHTTLGGEFLYDNTFAIRAGYMTGYETKGFSAGIGLIWNTLNFDYAFVPYKYDLGTSHVISVNYNF